MKAIRFEACPADCSAIALPRRASGTRIFYALPAALLAFAASAAAEQPVVDTDGDGLIEIHTIEDLNSIRYDLAGASLKRSAEDPGNAKGCPRGQCRGYELMADLDFDGPDDDTTTWTRNSDGSFTLDKDDHNSDWFDVEAGGWLPIGDCGPDGICIDRDGRTDETADNRPFAAIFDGNGHTIANLATSRALPATGLFGHLGRGGEIRNLGLVGNLSHCASAAIRSAAGGLVGYQSGGSITNSYTTGDADGWVRGSDPFSRFTHYEGTGPLIPRLAAGGLVGYLAGGSVAASYATGNAGGGSWQGDSVGGLVGYQSGGSIAASYATGNAAGECGGFDAVGGLVGMQRRGSIANSYATGNADGGSGVSDDVGGLVGLRIDGSIGGSYATGASDGGSGYNDSAGGLIGAVRGGSVTSSHATGSAYGGEGRADTVGGFVGIQNEGSITACHATGDAGGGLGRSDKVGGFAGQLTDGFITASYATGDADGGRGDTDDAGGLVGVQYGGFVVSSYATGNADGGRGDSDKAGGLVGRQRKGSIAASYATGKASGGRGADSAGGLVGYQCGGSITASYATGDADGGEERPGIESFLAEAAGHVNRLGGLVGQVPCGHLIRASWGFGLALRGDSSGLHGTDDRPEEARRISALTFGSGDEGTDAPPVWNLDLRKTSGAWDFGTPRQNPALVYADYDGEELVYHCEADAGNAPRGAILIPHCTSPATLIPGQRGEP